MVEESRRDGPLKRRGFLGGGFQVDFAIEENGRCSVGLAEGTEHLVFIKRIVCIGDFNVQMCVSNFFLSFLCLQVPGGTSVLRHGYRGPHAFRTVRDTGSLPDGFLRELEVGACRHHALDYCGSLGPTVGSLVGSPVMMAPGLCSFGCLYYCTDPPFPTFFCCLPSFFLFDSQRSPCATPFYCRRPFCAIVHGCLLAFSLATKDRLMQSSLSQATLPADSLC